MADGIRENLMDRPFTNGHVVGCDAFIRPTVEIVFAIEPFDVAYASALNLLPAHWDELAQHKELLKLDINKEFYQRGNKAGNIVVVTARAQSKIIGYVVWFIYKHPHYKDVLCAEDDVHFLSPEYRGVGLGETMIRHAERLVIELGVKHFSIREKVGHEHPEMMARLGYRPTDIVHTKTVE